MKSKIFIFTTLILVVFLFVITSCDNFLNAKNKTTININLDLSKILKTSRNETTSSTTEYILKVFAYNAATYKPEAEIQNLPLLTQTENKVDINGNVKASLDIEIGLNVIFVAKLYQGKSEKPLYAGKSEVIKIKATDNKVDLVLKRANTDLEIYIEVHQHTFATDWTSDATHHWHASTCGHTTEVSEKGEHTYINGICVCGMREMVLITDGTFQMGTGNGYYENDKPVHQVTITKSFYMGKYEVTQAEYEKYCSYTGSFSPSSSDGAGDGDNYPAYYVSWNDVLVYCNKRSIAEGLTPCYSISGNTDPSEWGTVPTSNNNTWDAVVCDWNANGYRLPTEAEWEYAARAGDNTVDAYTYAGTRDESQLGEYAWYKSNSDNITHEVGKKLPNAFGLYDMSGNVNEWCWNWYTDSYDTGKEGGSNPTGASSGSLRVARGGSSFSPSYFCAVSNRSSHHPNNSALGIGFRVVRTATEVIENLAHTHKFATEWTKDETHHWYAATCEHTDEKSGFAEHSFGNWTTTKEATEEAEGSRERSCTVCGYTATEVIEKLAHTHKFATDWTSNATHHWHAATCEHATEVSEKAEHTFEWEITQNPTETEKGEKTGTCTVCDYNETVEIEKIPEGFVFVKGTTINGNESWTPSSKVFVSGRKLTIPDLIVSDHEVTRGEYLEVMKSDPSIAVAYDKNGNKLTGEDVLNNPVNSVNWYDALVYCNKLSMAEGLTPCYSISDSTNPDDWGTVPTSSNSNNSTWDAVICNWNVNGYRLPTEAEWEWLARGGENYEYAGSDTVDDVAWYTVTTNETGTRDVKTKAPNGYGLYDMSGNVTEWCYDWYGSISDSTAAYGSSAGSVRVIRCGSWGYDSGSCAVSFRSIDSPGIRLGIYGFRVVRTATE